MASLAAVPRDASMIYGMGRLDSSGRVGDQAIIRALGWVPGDRLTVTQAAGAVVVTPDPHGMFVLAAKPLVLIPAPIRQWCAMSAGDRLLLAAAPDYHILVVHTMSALDAMVVDYHANLKQSRRL